MPRTEEFKRAIVDLAGAEERARDAAQVRDELEAVREERDGFRTENATLRAHAEAFEARLEEFKNSRELMTGHFNETASKLLNDAQKQFLERAEARFKQSEETAGQNLKSMLQPVSDRLLKHEETVTKVESERQRRLRPAQGPARGASHRPGEGQQRSGQAGQLAAQRAPNRAGAGASSSSRMCWKPAGYPNIPISRPKSASPVATKAGAFAPMPSSTCRAGGRW